MNRNKKLKKLLNASAARPCGLSDSLRKLKLFKEGTVTIGEIEAQLEGRGTAVLAIVLAVPFVQPLPLPGVSILFGLIQVAIGMKFVFGERGKLPSVIGHRGVSQRSLAKFVDGSLKVLRLVEKLFHPRLGFMLSPRMRQMAGVSIVAAGFALCLPLPPVVLFSNSLPAWSIILIGIGLLEKDGLMIMVGHVVGLATWVYFALLWEAASTAFAKFF